MPSCCCQAWIHTPEVFASVEMLYVNMEVSLAPGEAEWLSRPSCTWVVSCVHLQVVFQQHTVHTGYSLCCKDTGSLQRSEAMLQLSVLRAEL